METSFTAPPDRVSPSLLRPLPAWVARASPACVTPTGQIRLVHPVDPVQVPVGHAACPASPSLKRKTPDDSSDTSPVDDAGPTLVGLPGDRARAAAEDALVQANCKRASRMARAALLCAGAAGAFAPSAGTSLCTPCPSWGACTDGHLSVEERGLRPADFSEADRGVVNVDVVAKLRERGLLTVGAAQSQRSGTSSRGRRRSSALTVRSRLPVCTTVAA